MILDPSVLITWVVGEEEEKASLPVPGIVEGASPEVRSKLAETRDKLNREIDLFYEATATLGRKL